MAQLQSRKSAMKVTVNVHEPTVSMELSAARSVLEGAEWTCSSGKVHRIYPWDHGVWKCVRAEGFASSWEAVMLWYDAQSKMVWWGKNKEYYFDLCHPADKSGQICWYSASDARKVNFTWCNADLSCADEIEADKSTSGDTCLDDNATPLLACFNVRPPPGLELPVPPGLEDMLPPGLPCNLKDFDTAHGSSDDEETSAGCSTPRSERSEETSTASSSASPSIFSADAPTFVPILAHFDNKSENTSAGVRQVEKNAQQRTPLKAGAALFQPKSALPFMPAADVAEAWKRQGYVQPAAAFKRSARTAKKAAVSKPLQPGLQCSGTQAQTRLIQRKN